MNLFKRLVETQPKMEGKPTEGTSERKQRVCATTPSNFFHILAILSQDDGIDSTKYSKHFWSELNTFCKENGLSAVHDSGSIRTVRRAWAQEVQEVLDNMGYELVLRRK